MAARTAQHEEYGRTGDVAVEVDEGREVLQLLTHDEAQCGEHGYAAVGDLRGGQRGYAVR